MVLPLLVGSTTTLLVPRALASLRSSPRPARLWRAIQYRQGGFQQTPHELFQPSTTSRGAAAMHAAAGMSAAGQRTGLFIRTAPKCRQACVRLWRLQLLHSQIARVALKACRKGKVGLRELQGFLLFPPERACCAARGEFLPTSHTIHKFRFCELFARLVATVPNSSPVPIKQLAAKCQPQRWLHVSRG